MNTCMCVRVSTNLESPPTMGNLRCDWAPMSNRYRPPFGECCMCSLSLFRFEIRVVCVCGNLCTCVRVSTNLESPPIMGNFKV